MIQLRPYQEHCIENVRAELRRLKADGAAQSCILESPTGSGKTAMAAYMALGGATGKPPTVAFICHRRELIDQTALTFDQVGLDYGYIAAGFDRTSARVQICSVGTLTNRVHDIPAPDIVIWDECHHVGARTWSEIRHAWGDAIHIGLSATPARLDGKGLGSWFNALVPGPKVADLMAEGFLSTYDAYAPVVPNMKGVKKRAGDFAKGEMESTLNDGEILGGIVENWVKLAKGLKTIGFAISVKHSQAIVEAFCEAGIPAAHLDAKSSKDQRRSQLQAFARGEIHVLFNVDLFGEGFDLAANSGMDVTIEAVILARPTASIGLHLQQIGRALRPKEAPAVVLDHAGNIVRHGFPDDPREWSLEDKEIKQSDTGPKQCPRCYFLVARHKMLCPQCGFVWPEPEERKVTIIEGELEQIRSGKLTAAQLEQDLKHKRAEVAQTRSLDGLLRIQKSRNLPDGWAQRIFEARRSAAPPRRRL